jgi:hypothetical protein
VVKLQKFWKLQHAPLSLLMSCLLAAALTRVTFTALLPGKNSSACRPANTSTYRGRGSFIVDILTWKFKAKYSVLRHILQRLLWVFVKDTQWETYCSVYTHYWVRISNQTTKQHPLLGSRFLISKYTQQLLSNAFAKKKKCSQGNNWSTTINSVFCAIRAETIGARKREREL